MAKTKEDMGKMPQRRHDDVAASLLTNVDTARMSCIYVQGNELRQMQGRALTGAQVTLRTFTGEQLVLDEKQVQACSGFNTGKRVVLLQGPAGCGKTRLAMGLGLAGLSCGYYERLLLTRPDVEVENSGGIGALPGDMFAKLYDYFRPMLNALIQTVGPEVAFTVMQSQLSQGVLSIAAFQNMVAAGQIEFAYIGRLRGHDLRNTLVICDEGQNLTKAQTMMLLGRGGRMIMCGDLAQIDRPGAEYAADGAENGMYFFTRLIAQMQQMNGAQSSGAIYTLEKLYRGEEHSEAMAAMKLMGVA